MKQIIIADCKLFKAILTFISQDITGYLRSGILQLRSSWKLYSRINKQLFGLYQKFDQNTDQLFSFDRSTVDECVFDETIGSDEVAKEEDESIQNTLNELNINEQNDEIDIESIKRLLGAVGFGYGMFQIFMSFMPPNYLKLFNILGMSIARIINLIHMIGCVFFPPFFSSFPERVRRRSYNGTQIDCNYKP